MMPKNNNWTIENIPDQSGRVVIVTGANSGIGYETARALAEKGATVIMACRNIAKGNVAAQRLREDNPDGSIIEMCVDLADLASIRAFTTAFKQQYTRLDLLIDNAGVMALPDLQKTPDGFEKQFGTNHLGHFALTGLLLDRLLQTLKSRVVVISSTMHRRGNINFDDLQSKRSYSATGAYGQSKLANLLFTYELQRRFEAAGADSIAVAAHPGWTMTNLQQHFGLAQFLNPFIAQDPASGALPTLYAATAPQVQGGDYFGPSGFMELRGAPTKVSSNGRSHDQAAAKKLWSASKELTGVRYLALEKVAD